MTPGRRLASCTEARSAAATAMGPWLWWQPDSSSLIQATSPAAAAMCRGVTPAWLGSRRAPHAIKCRTHSRASAVHASEAAGEAEKREG